MTLLCGATVVTGNGTLDPGWVRVDGGLVSDLGAGDAPSQTRADDASAGVSRSLGGKWLIPGMVDIHVHGGGGASFDSHDPLEVLDGVEFHRRHGTTQTLASLVTAPVEHLLRSLSVLSELVDDGEIAGVHLEGPFISSSQCGAQDPKFMIAPDTEIMTRLLNAGRGTVRVVTIAPELPRSNELIRQITDAGALVAIGHSDASYDDAMRAIDEGVRIATHLFNGMRGGHHRDPGAVLAALTRPEVICELIVDSIHVHPAVLSHAIGSAGTDRIASVTDAISAAGEPDGSYQLGSIRVEVVRGIARVGGNQSLAGSTLTTDAALRHAISDVGLTLSEAVRVCSTTPASLIFGPAGNGPSHDGPVGGVIEIGARADLVVLNENFAVDAVMRGGNWVEDPGNIAGTRKSET